MHASNHLRAMGGIRPTSENLQEAFDGETYEVTTISPRRIQHDTDQGNCGSPNPSMGVES